MKVTRSYAWLYWKRISGGPINDADAIRESVKKACEDILTDINTKTKSKKDENEVTDAQK